MGSAWIGLRSLKRGMQAEFRRFNNLTSDSESPAARRLHTHLSSPKALADRGTLVYRDVLDGLLPDTLVDIFAFASLSHAISRILVRRKRMQEAQVLSGLQRWGDCIQDADERGAFYTLASGMWPSSFESSPRGEWPSTSSPHGGNHPSHAPEVQDNGSLFLKQAAAITAAEIGRVSEGLSSPRQSGISPANMEQEVLDITSLTGQEFNFSLLCGSGDDGDGYVAPRDIDPKEIGRFYEPGQPIPGYCLSPLSAPAASSSPPTSSLHTADCHIPPPQPSPGLSFTSQDLYEFRITEKVYDCPVLNLRNTVLFLAVFAFVQDTGECFYLLSGNGKTVARSRIGSASASERSKIERRLRKEFFEPPQKGRSRRCPLLSAAGSCQEVCRAGFTRDRRESPRVLAHCIQGNVMPGSIEIAESG